MVLVVNGRGWDRLVELVEQGSVGAFQLVDAACLLLDDDKRRLAVKTVARTERCRRHGDGSRTGWDGHKKSRELLESHNGYYIDHSGSKTLYLTFDEGYENGFTAQILDVLASENVPAAFFVTGPYLENQQELVKRMIDEGHTVGNHTVNHMNLSKQTAQKVQSEINNLNKRCAELYGVNMKYMRPPEGEYSEKVLSVAEDMGYKTILWSFAYKDWDVNLQKGEDYAFSQITPYLHDG